MRLNKEITCDTSNGAMQFQITQLGGMSSGMTLIRILPLIPQFLALLPKGLKLDDLRGAMKEGAAALLKFDLASLDWAKIGSILATLTPEEFERVTVDMLAGSFAIGNDPRTGEEIKVQLTRANLDQLFAGHVWDLLKLVGAALMLNYASFSKGAGEIDPRLKQSK